MARSIDWRLEALEGRPREHPPGRSTDARERMKAHLGQLARYRRGELLSEEEEAEVMATHSAIEDRLTITRGEGGR